MSEPTVTTVDVDAWVGIATNPKEHEIRRVMRVILLAIAETPSLRSRMVMKGGVLLALRYGTGRHTKDLDFSTEKRAQEENREEILRSLDGALAKAVIQDDSILCRVQSSKMEPPRAEDSFPTLRIRIGYAIKGSKQFQRMRQGSKSATTVLVDLSFNEHTCITSAIAVDGHELSAYSLYDQIAEKYRAMIQQTADRRNRVRRQDIYDVFTVIYKGYLASAEDKAILLATMRQKFSARDVSCERSTIEEPEIAQRCKQQYAQLADEIDGELPDFDFAFGTVKDFYLNLPW